MSKSDNPSQQQNQNHSPIDVANLASKYDKCLYHFVLRRVRNEDDARDIVQTTYMEAIRSAHNFRHESQPKTWLIGIALNLSKNKIYKDYRRNEVKNMDNDEGSESWLDNLASTEINNPEDLASDKEIINNIIKIFKKMPKDMRETALMVLIENISYEDAAKELNVPIGTIRSRVARARQLLRAAREKETFENITLTIAA